VLADNYLGKRFNSPNDVVVKRDGSIWFSDPPFQAGNYYEGHKIQTELPDAVYRIDGSTLEVTRVIEGIAGPNGLCFSPDESTLYVVEGRAKPNRMATSGAAGAAPARRKPTRKAWTAYGFSVHRVRRSAIFTCRNAAPTCASAVCRATACMRCT